MKSRVAVRSPAHSSVVRVSGRIVTHLAGGGRPLYLIRAAHTVTPSEARRRIFFRVRSCERVGLRREESLFSCERAISALGVKSLSPFFLATHDPPLTIHSPSLSP